MREAVISPFYMLRVGGLSAATLDELSERETVRALDDFDLVEATLGSLCQPLEECLFRLVPLLDDHRELRRSALSLKRDVHNMRLTEISHEMLDQIRHYVPINEQALLDRWLLLMRDRADHQVALTQVCAREVRSAGGRLAAMIQAPELYNAIALASHDFAQALMKGGSMEEWTPTGRLARTSMAYATRAAVKTSPFSTLTRVAFGELATAQENPGDVVATARRVLVHTLLHTCARDPELAQVFHYERTTGMWTSGDRVILLSPQIQVTGDLVSRQERAVALQATNPILTALQSFARGRYSELGAALPTGTNHETVVQLLNLGLILPVAPWARDSQTPLHSLATALRSIPEARAQELANTVDSLETLINEVTTINGISRSHFLGGVRTKAELAFHTLKVPSPNWLTQDSLVYEDARSGGWCPELGPYVHEDLGRIAIHQRSRLLKASAYQVVRAQFVEQYGSGGDCTEILPFLGSFLSDSHRNATLQDALKRDMLALLNPERAGEKRDSGASAALPACSLFFQIAGNSHDDVLSGHYLLVVNRYNSGLGGLMARFAALFPSVATSLTEWLQGLYPDAELMDFPLLADCNNLQAGCSVSRRALYWPTETPTTDANSALRLKNLRLRDDPSSESLVLLDDRGAAVAPAYLGVIPDYLIGGAMRLFFMLLNPWLVADTLRPAVLTGTPAPQGIEFIPRVQEGRIVFERARWRMPPSEFPLRQRGEGDLSYLQRVHRWRRRNNLPDEVFLKVEEKQLVLDSRKRKPTWISFTSLHSLEAARHIIDEHAIAVNLVEALPGRESHWVKVPDGSARAAEFVTLIRWSKENATEASDAAD